MEFLAKLYNDKPSKIAVKYAQEYSAVKAYEDIYSKRIGDAFSMKAEVFGNKLKLQLISEQTGQHLLYKELEYKVEALKKLLAFIKPDSNFQFVHVYCKNNTLMIAKPFRKENFLKVKNFEMIGSEIFGGADKKF